MALRILVVEDEMTIALLLEDMLQELGHTVVDMAMRLPHALQLARTAEFDMAIVDVNLDGHMSFPVVDILRGRGLPFVFATGYGSAGLDSGYRDNLVIKKPFNLAELRNAIGRAVSPTSP